ncbi:flavonol sulfotransferase-like [Rutidosis leptorrhynchoides]|uniref:flavonol sulfotransferase-like n=1 Tax=Rutidosis leptorrhynchoides TaxID=125765 RepID=UPI003A995149
MSLLDASKPSFVNRRNEKDRQDEKARFAALTDKYKDRLTTLPTEKDWVFDKLYMYQGFWYMSNDLVSIYTLFALQETFKARPTDIYVVTFPKCGTTWIKALVFAIVNRNIYKIDSRTHPLLIHNSHDCVPFIETDFYKSIPTYNEAHSPRLFGTHTPYTSLPQSIIDSGCRIVYLCRDPKDVLVSLHHFVNQVRDKSRGLMTINEAFELFSKGVTPYGPYWDHVKGYYKAKTEHPTRILFLTYEDMKMDTRNNVKRIAEFLGCPFTKDEEGRGLIEEILSLCSFENLKNADKDGFFHGVPNSAYFREGKVGGWSDHLTNEMSLILDQIIKEKFHGLDISF